MNKVVSIVVGLVFFLAALSELTGIKMYDIIIFGGKKPKPTIQTPSETQQTVRKKIGYRALHPGNAPPFASAQRLPKTRTSSHPAKTDSFKTLQFPTLMEVLKDLPNSSDKFEFIEENKNSMPDKLSWTELNQILKLFPNASGKSRAIAIFLTQLAPNLSLDELHLILKMFPRADDRLKVIRVFLPRLPPTLSLRELNRLLALFNNASEKFDILEIFRPRLGPFDAGAEFETFRDHFSRSSDKNRALNLLLSEHN